MHFFICIFNSGIAYGAQVGLKRRLCLGFGVSFSCIGVLSNDISSLAFCPEIHLD